MTGAQSQMHAVSLVLLKPAHGKAVGNVGILWDQFFWVFFWETGKIES